MVATHSDEESREKVRDLIKDVKTAMMVTQDGSQLRGRPMVAADIDKDGRTLWFYTRANTPKTDEIDGDPQVLLAYSDPSAQNYVSVSGRARTVRDPAKQKELWQETMRTWFPNGPESPEVALIAVTMEGAEYWDSHSSTLLHSFGYVKSLVTGQPPKGGENEKVSFGA